MASAAVTARLQPLVDRLVAVYADDLRAVVGYGEWLTTGGPATVLVVLADASCRRLRGLGIELHTMRRSGVVPLFLAPDELPRSTDVFPLEFLDLRAVYQVVYGSDPLATLTFAPGPLRQQAEGELRSALHCLRQDIARYGHRRRPTAQVLAESVQLLPRLLRGLVVLAGGDPPGPARAVLHTAAVALRLEEALLHRLWPTPQGDAVDELVDAWDELLSRLIAWVDAWDG